MTHLFVCGDGKCSVTPVSACDVPCTCLMFTALCMLVWQPCGVTVQGPDSVEMCGCCSDVGEGPRWEHLKLVHSMAGELQDLQTLTLQRDRGGSHA